MNNGVIDIRRLGVFAVIAGGLCLGGCASQQNYDQLLDANRTLKERNEELQRQNQELTNENGLLQKQRTANESALTSLTQMNDTLKKQLADAGVDLNELNKRLQGLSLSPVDPDTDRALSALASQYPDMIKYDSSKGMLRFASDLTFNSGDDAVQESAKASLNALAKILTAGAASAYDVFIVGHTDAQPISSRTSGRHPTNMHLSAHRAIAVRSALASMGVPADKMEVAGWGEFRPAVPNSGPKGNTPQNRRVEIYLTRSTATSMGETDTTTTTPSKPTKAPKEPARTPDMIK
jgi:chemotaxis protein MotB